MGDSEREPQIITLRAVALPRRARVDQAQVPAETPNLIKCQPDVGQTDSRNRSAEEIVRSDARN